MHVSPVSVSHSEKNHSLLILKVENNQRHQTVR